MLIVLELPVKNIAAVCGVDLFDSQFFGILNSIAVSCSSAGDGANAANLDGSAGVRAGSSGLAGSDGAGISEETAEVASEVAVEPQAARLTAMEAASIALMTFLFIVIPS